MGRCPRREGRASGEMVTNHSLVVPIAASVAPATFAAIVAPSQLSNSRLFAAREWSRCLSDPLPEDPVRAGTF